MTTELINELRSAATTLRKPFPTGWTSASDKAAAELLERAAEHIQAVDRRFDQWAHTVGKEAAYLHGKLDAATRRAWRWRKLARRYLRLYRAGVRHMSTEDLAKMEKLVDLQAMADQRAHPQNKLDAEATGEPARTLGVLDAIAENLFDRVRRGVLTPAQAAAKLHRHTTALRLEIEGLQRNADRYLWLRGADGLNLELLDMVGDELDAAVDAARPTAVQEPVALPQDEVRHLRALCACAYQMAGYHDAPAPWLNMLGDAASGVPLSEWRQKGQPADVLLPYAPAAATADSDRAALLYLMQQFDAESWQCPRCGHAEDTATMDSADYLRRYLEDNPLPQVHKQVSATTQSLIDMMVQRDQAGRAKYGTTLDRTDLSQADWLQHLAEELLDGAGYALRAKQCADSDQKTLAAWRRQAQYETDVASAAIERVATQEMELVATVDQPSSNVPPHVQWINGQTAIYDHIGVRLYALATKREAQP